MTQETIDIPTIVHNWSPIVQIIIGLWVAAVATIALNTWKKQIKAQKYADFISELTDVIHEFILAISSPVSSIKFTQIAIRSHQQVNDMTEHKRDGAIDFITEYGNETRNEIQKQLEVVRPILSKIKSLVAKGQILEIKNYSQCQNACEYLEWSFNQIDAFSSFLGRTNLNWENKEVMSTLEKILSINSEEIIENITKQNQEYLLFAREAYKKL